jgi:hypothetical protein
MNVELAGAIDLHVHCAPDVRRRKLTAVELVKTAQAAGMRGLLLKNHDLPTTSLAATLRETVPGIEIFGGLVLNEAVGGFNPRAVEIALAMSAAAIWMPTYCAEQERAWRGKPGTGMSVLAVGHASGLPSLDYGELRPEVRAIVRLVAEHGATLATGHLSADEIHTLVRCGRELGVRKFLINHPEINFQTLPLEFQREIAGSDLYFERCYVRAGFSKDWDGLAEAIRATGIERNVLATDLGQPENADPITGLDQMRYELAARGFSKRELREMMCENPAKLLGLG